MCTIKVTSPEAELSASNGHDFGGGGGGGGRKRGISFSEADPEPNPTAEDTVNTTSNCHSNSGGGNISPGGDFEIPAEYSELDPTLVITANCFVQDLLAKAQIEADLRRMAGEGACSTTETHVRKKCLCASYKHLHPRFLSTPRFSLYSSRPYIIHPDSVKKY